MLTSLSTKTSKESINSLRSIAHSALNLIGGDQLIVGKFWQSGEKYAGIGAISTF